MAGTASADVPPRQTGMKTFNIARERMLEYQEQQMAKQIGKISQGSTFSQ